MSSSQRSGIQTYDLVASAEAASVGGSLSIRVSYTAPCRMKQVLQLHYQAAPGHKPSRLEVLLPSVGADSSWMKQQVTQILHLQEALDMSQRGVKSNQPL